MSKFMNALAQTSTLTYTENGEGTFTTSDSKVVDLFSRGGALRKVEANQVRTLISQALAEDTTSAILTLFYLRDVRQGQGERRLFRLGLVELHNQYPELFRKIVPTIIEYGRWDDLFPFVGVVDEATALVRSKFFDFSDTLLHKWLPSENTSSSETKTRARQIRQILGISSKEYRKTLSEGRRRNDIVEAKMSARQWTEIKYDHVPSVAMKNYTKAFWKHDEDGMKSYIGAVEKGEKKINSSVLYPNQIVEMVINSYSTDTNRTADAMWKALPDLYEGRSEEALVVADVSGSMSGTPLNVSIALAIYMAERNTNPAYKNKFITFSGKPTLESVVGKTLYEKVRNLNSAHWEMNTNLQKVFELVLDTAVSHNIPQEEMVKRLYIISDMEFDAATRGSGHTMFQKMSSLYESKGYKLPQLVFWNVNARNENSPVKFNDSGVALVSGFSPNILRSLLKADVKEITPAEVVRQTIYSDRYKPILTILES